MFIYTVINKYIPADEDLTHQVTIEKKLDSKDFYFSQGKMWNYYLI